MRRMVLLKFIIWLTVI